MWIALTRLARGQVVLINTLLIYKDPCHYQDCYGTGLYYCSRAPALTVTLQIFLAINSLAIGYMNPPVNVIYMQHKQD